jgi:hypothetical protein
MAQNITPYGMQAQGQNKNDEWEKYLNQAKLAMSMDGETALGLALGKAIRYFWDQNLAKRHAKNDLKEKQSAEVASGNISDVDAFRKANNYPVAHTADVPLPENWQSLGTGGDAKAPATDAWSFYAESNSVPGSRNYVQEAVNQVMPTPTLNTGAMTTDDLVAALAGNDNKRRWF